ncbi:ABC transporter substrate-binding protein [Sodalis sp. dw_96]|uniref:ABC transporter substrate-binding protein n=1 Tax=Sodalis sp. dw_96 TaxID=2719794 RepID=UPI001BD64ED8|nr:ABC transporter substrate-binding protein [Sodalis sp. dw_96]
MPFNRIFQKNNFNRALMMMLPIFAVAGNPALAQNTTTAGHSNVLTIGLAEQSQCIDPQQDNYGYAAIEGRGLVDSLTDQSYEDPSKISPWLAESWEINADATRYTFHIRKDVTFSDGSKLNAPVIKDNFDTITKIPGAAGASYFKGVKSITAPDDHTLVIEFDSPNVPFLAATSTGELGIVAAATLAKTPEQRCHEGVIGSGPFVLDSVKLNEKTELVKRRGYDWPSSQRKHTGEAYLDRVIYRIIPESTVRTGALRSHQVNVIQDTGYDDAQPLAKEGFPLEKIESLGTAVNLLINTSRGILADEKVRQAFSKAINRQEVVDLAFSGYKIPATGVLTRKTPGYLDQSALLAFDLNGANTLLDQAGWKKGSDGIRVKNGKPLQITVSFYAAPVNQAFLEVVQQQVRDAGFDLRLRPLTGGAYDEALLAGDYDLHRWEWSLGDPDVLRQLYSTKALNRFRLSTPNDLDGPLEAQRATTDPAERKKLTDEAQKIILQRAYAVPVFFTQELWSNDGTVRNLEWGGPGAGSTSQILYDVTLSPAAS